MPVFRPVHVAITGLVAALAAVLVPLLPSAPARPAPATQVVRSEAAVAPYMPLTPGRSMTYRRPDGDQFTHTYGNPLRVTWFDGSVKRVVPVHDTRCGCHVLMTEAGGEVRAVGTLTGDSRPSAWGEYVIIFPANSDRPVEPVRTPAGLFLRAIRIENAEGTTWFAPGVGIIRIDEYGLVNGPPRT